MPKGERLIGLVVRHGEAFNNQQGIFRSCSDVPLTKTGLSQAMSASKFLSKYPVKAISTSPLLRAFVTADLISKPHNLFVFQTRGLFPWSLGVFTGLDRKDNKDALTLFVNNPSVTVPNGESLNDFSDRMEVYWKTALKIAERQGLTVWVCHNSVLTELDALVKGEKGNPVGESVKPGGVAAVYYDGQHYRLEPIFGIAEPATLVGS